MNFGYQILDFGSWRCPPPRKSRTLRSEIRNRKSTGFTLVEVIMCMIVMAVALPPLLNVFAEGASEAIAPLQVARANWLSIEKVEDVLADRFSTTRGWSYLINSNYPTETNATGFTNYTRSVTITEVSGTDLITPQAGSDFKRIDIDVTWTYSGSTRTVQLNYVVVQ